MLYITANYFGSTIFHAVRPIVRTYTLVESHSDPTKPFRPPIAHLYKHWQPAVHRQRQAALTPPLPSLVPGNKVKGPHHGCDDLDCDQLGHLPPEARPGPTVEHRELVRGPRHDLYRPGLIVTHEPALGLEGIGVLAPGGAGAVHGPGTPDDDRRGGEVGPVREGGGALGLLDLKGNGREEAEGFGKHGMCIGQGGGRKEGWVEWQFGGGGGGGGGVLRLGLCVEEALNLVADLGVDVAVLKEEVEGPCQRLGRGVAASGRV